MKRLAVLPKSEHSLFKRHRPRQGKRKSLKWQIFLAFSAYFVYSISKFFFKGSVPDTGRYNDIKQKILRFS